MTQAADGVTAQDVRGAVFPKPPMGKRGYDVGAVDDSLDRIGTAIDGVDST